MNTKKKKRFKIASSNQDECRLDDHKNNKTQEPASTEKVTVKVSVDVKKLGEVVESAVVPEKHTF